MSSNDILGALQSILALLSKVRPDFFPTLKDLLEKLSGESSQMWWAELKRFVCKKPCWLPNILRIDRSVKFDPVKFLGNGWKIEEEDEQSLALTEISLTQVRLEHMLKDGEDCVKGKTKLERLKQAKHVRLDARVFQTLWEDQSKIPESWKEVINGKTTYIYFDGTVLRDPGGNRVVLCLFWDICQWHWRARWLGDVWNRLRPSAVLAKAA